MFERLYLLLLLLLLLLFLGAEGEVGTPIPTNSSGAFGTGKIPNTHQQIQSFLRFVDKKGTVGGVVQQGISQRFKD